MAKKIEKIVAGTFGREYEIVVSGGGEGVKPGVPIPRDTVDSDAIIDGSIGRQDLSEDVIDAMVTDADRVTQDDLDKFEV